MTHLSLQTAKRWIDSFLTALVEELYKAFHGFYEV